MAFTEREAFLLRFHARAPGITSRVLARSGSYERIAERVASSATRVLDLGCGDGALVRALRSRGCDAFGIDLSADELALAPRGICVRGRAQRMPFASAAFDSVVSHFAFMLLDDVEDVVAELARVLVPGGRFVAVLGGGPTAQRPGEPEDAFHRALEIARPYLARAVRLGDPRAKSESGWNALFDRWREISFERDELVLDGSIEDVWQFLAASYEFDAIRDVDREQIRLRLAEHIGEGGRAMCRAVIWIATAIR
ncbi:MAG TPA: class I SAM-dependent methyltransferase [Kofleriaceae bacterium]|nr:class I SAM-dependent methyltransferase [Kofleriaceae bacterium]